MKICHHFSTQSVMGGQFCIPSPFSLSDCPSLSLGPVLSGPSGSDPSRLLPLSTTSEGKYFKSRAKPKLKAFILDDFIESQVTFLICSVRNCNEVDDKSASSTSRNDFHGKFDTDMVRDLHTRSLSFVNNVQPTRRSNFQAEQSNIFHRRTRRRRKKRVSVGIQTTGNGLW